VNAAGQTVYYELPEQAPVLQDNHDGTVTLRATAIDAASGEVIQDLVQERGAQEVDAQGRPIWLDAPREQDDDQYRRRLDRYRLRERFAGIT